MEIRPANYSRCFVGDALSPFQVTEVSEAIFAAKPCIVVEFDDIQQQVAGEIGAAIIRESNPDGKVQYLFHLADARHLCCHLIHALVNTDDRIAKRLEETLTEVMEELRGKEEEEG